MAVLRLALAVVVLLAINSTSLPGGPDFSDWSDPVNLGLVVNSTGDDSAPAVSKDGLSLYFHSTRPNGFGENDIYVSQRNSEDEPWGPPANLGGVVNTAFFESRPTLSRDGHWLFFSSNRPEGLRPGLDIWASYREHTHDDFDWQTPVHLGDGVNRAMSSEIEASYVANDDGGSPLLYFVSNRPGGFGGFDVYASELLPNGDWGGATHVPELSTTMPDQSVSVRFDGLEAFVATGVPPAAFHLWVSTRDSVFDPWSAPVKLAPPVNTDRSEESPEISADRLTLYFESNRPGGIGARDLWMTTRTKKNGK